MMALGMIIISKLSETNHIGYYKVTTPHYDCNDFFISIDKNKKVVRFYSSENFVDCMREIGPNSDEVLGNLPNIPTSVSTRTLMKAFNILKMNNFPEEIITAS